MLAHGSGTCDRCNSNFSGIVQYMELKCNRCDYTATLCPGCSMAPCHRCSGRMETEQERLAGKGIHIIY